MVQVDYGQAQIQAVNDAVAAGTLKLDPEAVDDVVGVLDRLIAELETQRDKALSGGKNTGLAGFPSAQQLAIGFAGKVDQLATSINQYILGAMRLQEACLRAANRLGDADMKNAQAVAAAAAGLSPSGAA
ncbi:hypothetical protein [Nocardia mangyaensis]|uniref:hypothetical protein n=1 Tax=Nocardia mangyaensis TaxID=2213200 RepID=UPI0026752E54|nr:hypothetical protein [Nocardia mangyaensis]MDO3651247.1 hypothetical protein [Nocardia mangyaensis]